ncbi:MAG: helix-turn-helix domain-containing protein [Planctomycetaceae bacterium]|nr:helix-turn-helix domain-containing protein [Planctomycetaceae bacterium]
MAQFYTLEEAALVLGMSPEDLKAKAQHREVRAFLDGGSWRFRVVDIDELARSRGMGSDAELPLSDLELSSPAVDSDSDAELSEHKLETMEPAKPAPGEHPNDLPSTPVSDSISDHEILLDDLSLPPDSLGKSSSVIIGMHTTTSKMPSDSDVRLIPDVTPGTRPSDSDVRLAAPATRGARPSDSDVTLIDDDSTEQGPRIAGPGDTAVRPSPVLGSSAELPADVPPADSDSDFDLTPSDVIDALQPESGSDFELSTLDESSSSDEFDSSPLAKPGDSDVTAADPGFSGINLSRPSDSGIGLQTAPGFGLADASSLELAPLSGSDLQPAPPPQASVPPGRGSGKTAPEATPPPRAPRPPGKDIFDDTDFEVDAFEVDAFSSESDFDDRTVQLEAASDFELEECEVTSSSDVFAIDEDEDDVDQNAVTALGPAALVDEEEDDRFGGATSGEIAGTSWDVESEVLSTASRGVVAGPVLASSAASAEWGGLWVGLLGVATVFLLFLAFVSMDLVRNLHDYQGDTPASGIVKSLSGLLFG